MREEYPAADYRPDCYAALVFHSPLPDPFQQLPEDFAGGIYLARVELLVVFRGFRAETVAVNGVVIEVCRWFEVPVLGVGGDTTGWIGGAVRRQKTSSRTNRRSERIDFAETTS